MTDPSNAHAMSDRDNDADELWWKRLRKASAILALLLVGLWIGWALWGVEWLARYRRGSYGIPTAEELGQTGDIFGGISALFAALALLGVSIGAAIQAHTASLLRRQVADARRSSEMQLRAYVNLSAATIHWDGINLEAVVQFKNFGQTPAYDVRLVAVVQANGKGVRPYYDYLATLPAGGSSIIGPGSEYSLRMKMDVGEPPSLETLILAQRIAHVWGKVTYRDVFSSERETNFRMESHGEYAKQLRFTPALEGNSAT